MRIWFSPYALESANRLNAKSDRLIHSGSLLRIEYDSGGVGYSALHPWPELGDIAIDKQLDMLRNGGKTSLIEESLKFARIDGQARTLGQSLWSFDLPISHVNLGDINSIADLPRGFDTCKLKLGKNWLEAAQKLNELNYITRWRFDFNGSLSAAEVNLFWEALNEQNRLCVEFIEDPCPAAQMSQLHPEIPIGLDREAENWQGGKIKTLILKPAIQDVFAWVERFKGVAEQFVVTSYLDHPIGQCQAAYWAGQLQKKFGDQIGVCGLNSHWSFARNPFSEFWYQKRWTGEFIPPVGTGFGFDGELEKVDWQAL